MSTGAELESLQAELRRVRSHNRRYREVIQNLSSRQMVLQARLAATFPGLPVVTAFESFGRLETTTVDEGCDWVLPPAKSGTGGSVDVDRTHEALKPLTPQPGWKCLAVDRPQLRIGFTLFGMTERGVEEAVDLVEQRQVRSRDFVPVFFTDRAHLGPFRSRGYVVEYVHTAGALGQRLDFLTTKWGLHKRVDLGLQECGGEG